MPNFFAESFARVSSEAFFPLFAGIEPRSHGVGLGIPFNGLM